MDRAFCKDGRGSQGCNLAAGAITAFFNRVRVANEVLGIDVGEFQPTWRRKGGQFEPILGRDAHGGHREWARRYQTSRSQYCRK